MKHSVTGVMFVVGWVGAGTLMLLHSIVAVSGLHRLPAAAWWVVLAFQTIAFTGMLVESVRRRLPSAEVNE